MGASGIMSTLIMFIAVVAMSLTVITVFKNVIDDSTAALQIQGNAIADTLKTDVSIESVSYNNITDITSISVRNTGKTKLDVDLTDVYIDGVFIPRNTTNRTISVQESTDLKNPGIWDSDEIAQINVFMVLADGDHTLTVSTQYGFQEEDIFSSE